MLVGGLSDRPGMKGCGLQYNAGGLISDRGELATHHTRQGGRFLAVGDYQVAGLQAVIFAVQCKKSLFLFGASDNDGRAGIVFVFTCQHVIIKRVQGMTGFQHHIVGDIHHIVDRPEAGFNQGALDPERGFANLDMIKQPGCVTRTELRVPDLQFEGHRAILASGGSDKFRKAEWQSQ